ncbi:transcriptional regulator [bacterium CG10_46_32]|nr:MAG: transcriptional regulator [bacterium CG10_46_32]PIR56026.1 MAG: YebC/PmpR family DNA-binding transcriptional regulator [Parcubacteria group bacterium CG10_big_fil_rev_8_21_14_0_10_46_32]
MSGHSKWNSIKHQKAAADAKKGAAFTRMARNITLATREGGGIPETNAKLRMALDQARSVNMPKDNIARAIAKGTGEGSGEVLTENIYEGYGPAGVALIIKVVTDNTNRSVSDLRHALSKHGGSLGESGSVMWNFELKGVIRVQASGANRESIELAAIEAGADDIKNDTDSIIATTDPRHLQELKKTLEAQEFIIEFADIEYVPKNTVALSEADKKKLESLTEALEDLEDVNDFYDNAV